MAKKTITHFAQLPRPWFALGNCVIIAHVITREVKSVRRMHIETTSRGGFTDANGNAHQRRYTSECERSNLHQMLIKGTACVNIYVMYSGHHSK